MKETVEAGCNCKNTAQFDFKAYVVDAMDTVTGKLELVIDAGKSGTPIISSMGAGSNALIKDLCNKNN